MLRQDLSNYIHAFVLSPVTDGPAGGDYLPMSGYELGSETPMLFGTASEGSSSERRWPPNSTWPFFFWYSWMRFSTSGPARCCQ